VFHWSVLILRYLFKKYCQAGLGKVKSKKMMPKADIKQYRKIKTGS